MTKQDMYCRLKQAIETSIAEARHFVTNELPDDYLLDIHIGMEHLGRMTLEDLFALVWNDDKVRRWVDIVVGAVENGKTVLRVRLAHDFKDYEELTLMYKKPLMPFNIFVPPSPRGWRVTDERGLPDVAESLRVHGKYELVRR